MKKILIVEDDPTIRHTLADFLRHDGHLTCEADRGDIAVETFIREQPDLIVLDLNLPGLDGIDVCRQIRSRSQIPILMLTARREETDQVKGLQMGAEDYLLKPFSPKVLVVKVRKWLERPLPDNHPILRFHDLEIDREAHTVRRLQDNQQAETVLLTRVEFNLLEVLASQPKRSLSRDMLLDHMYDDTLPPDIFDRTVDTHIKNLRRKLGTRDYIETVRGIGYKAAEET